MSRYLLIESRDPYESNDVGNYYTLARGLAKEGNQVTLFLCQNGVLAARDGGKSALLSSLGDDGVEILADDFSLHERGIAKRQLVKGVKEASLEVVVDRLEAGDKTLWH